MLEKLLEKIQNNCHNVDIELVTKAFNLSMEAHKNQKRESGEPYIIHPVEVACILAELGLDTSTIAAGLLHDVIEDTEYTYEDICNIFSVEVADLVQGVSKLEKMKFKTKEEQQADNVRKMLLAMAKDIRVILIKLADRLHNMRTLKYKPEVKQRETAKETLNIYAPLAHRLGISKIKWELEDLALRYLNASEYYDLVKLISEKRAEREDQIEHIIFKLKSNLDMVGIKSEIEGRPKHFYSIYRKMITKNKTIDQIFDLTAVRILVDDIGNCYASLGIVHTMYKPIPGRFKDYIAMPKPNMYQSIHTTVIGPFGKPVEIQIRTYDMHRTAEYGIAAHWKYKEGVEGDNDSLESRLSWLREMLEWQGETADAEEFMEGFKIDLFSDEVFVFTPKGDVISLPHDSTPIDFAYSIHTDIGHKCTGAKVNGKIVQLTYGLKTGEIVEVITSPNSKGPSIDWINIAKSNRAKSKIKVWFKKSRRDESIEKGKEYLEREAKKQGFTINELIKSSALEKILKRYNLKNLEDLYATLGVNEILPNNIVNKLKEPLVESKKALTQEEENKSIEEKISKYNNKISSKKDGSSQVQVKGESNLLIRYAKCCNPVPGDQIIGYITKGKGVSVHRKDCKNLTALQKSDDNKIVEVSWGSEKISGRYVTELQIKAEDRFGILTEAINLLNEAKTSINSVNAKATRTGEVIINIKISITSTEQLIEIQKKIRRLNGVYDVYRIKN
ncbi:RelA/SpoT family protein [Clostridium sp. UBA6640]|uniref:RelA/SpoT family protein n=1 Tax=Clostridium sp. UBA6640 TaxID=1946370 RepID=UPI0025C1980F|nr:bifunctional (p)ppGpp synthetase/guanosine-3',5'-bis(diphosphate) 3'-pyrophosphohydrolase [Clostridium sp. UBA6640]